MDTQILWHKPLTSLPMGNRNSNMDHKRLLMVCLCLLQCWGMRNQMKLHLPPLEWKKKNITCHRCKQMPEKGTVNTTLYQPTDGTTHGEGNGNVLPNDTSTVLVMEWMDNPPDNHTSYSGIDCFDFSFCRVMNLRQEEKRSNIPAHYILLNNQSTVDVFCNRHLLKDIRQCNTTRDVICTNLIRTIPGYCMVWYPPHGIANMLSLASVGKMGTWWDTDRTTIYSLRSRLMVLLMSWINPKRDFTAWIRMLLNQNSVSKQPLGKTNPDTLPVATPGLCLHKSSEESFDSPTQIIEKHAFPIALFETRCASSYAYSWRLVWETQRKTESHAPELLQAERVQIPGSIVELNHTVMISANITFAINSPRPSTSLATNGSVSWCQTAWSSACTPLLVANLPIGTSASLTHCKCNWYQWR